MHSHFLSFNTSSCKSSFDWSPTGFNCLRMRTTLWVDEVLRMVKSFMQACSFNRSYDFQQSLLIKVPGTTCFFINEIKVAASRLLSSQISSLNETTLLLVTSIIPKIQVPSTMRPLLYFRLPILLSSINNTSRPAN